MEKKIISELTPELADKIWGSVQDNIRRKRESKQEVLHHLKQLKAQMGKLKPKKNKIHTDAQQSYEIAISNCMNIIDKKISKVNNI